VVFHDTGAGTADMSRRIAGATIVVVDPATVTPVAAI
jgi:hypothetical protein